MKQNNSEILLVGINSKYTHTSLSIRTLFKNAESENVSWIEHTINEPIADIIKDIFKYAPSDVCFSCYIWNIEYVIKITKVITQILTNTKIVLGGPEVSYDAKSYLEKYPFIHMVIRGEGEQIFKQLVKSNFNDFSIMGITYRYHGKIIENDDASPIENLDDLVFPYSDEDLEKNKNKLIYYESSRGCPFNCSYCLSSTIKNVRYKSVEKTCSEIKLMVDKGVRIIKFVDRTFNSDKKRAYELVKFIEENGKNTTFHFEIAAHIITDEFLELLSKAPNGMFQFEIGVQSTNPCTINAINRKTDYDRIANVVSQLMSKTNVMVHLDLIAGLPYEDYNSFVNSFNTVCKLNPDVLQLGFLKLLHGTQILREANDFNYSFLPYPPYEVLSNKFISFKEILSLKNLENVFELYHNSNSFKKSLIYLSSCFDSAFSLYNSIAEFFESIGYNDSAHSKRELYDILADFGHNKNIDDIFYDYLKYDLFTENKNIKTPKWSLDEYDLFIHKNRLAIIDAISEINIGNVRGLLKIIHFERFSYDVEQSGEKMEIVYIFQKDGALLQKISISKIEEIISQNINNQ